MCGIWGYVGSKDGIEVGSGWRGLESLEDRGPDDWGVYLEDRGKVTNQRGLPSGTTNVFLGNRRLSIFDLSPAGNQPMSAADGRFWIVYNGEVYNYRELRQDLIDRGHGFHSDSDTEVVLHAYMEHGEDCVDHLRGMFAFGILDRQQGTLFAARDRFGIKPFYYEHRGDGITFASEVTALLESGVTDFNLDEDAVDGYLTFGYVPAPRTIIDGVRSIPPGSTMRFDRSTGEYRIRSYWEPQPSGNPGVSLERIRELLEESVRLRLRSDVPVGAFLSGGLDSSAIVALMRLVSSTEETDIRTFSIGFDDADYSETDFAETVARSLDTDHTNRTVSAGDVEDAFDDIIAAMDQPTIDGVNTYFVSQLAADDGLKVALSGLGSDELFGGYPAFDMVPKLVKGARITAAFPQPIRKAIAKLLDGLGRYDGSDRLLKLSDVVRSDSPIGASYLAVRGLFTQSQRTALLGDRDVDWASAIEATLPPVRLLGQVSSMELTWYMHNQLLRDTDAMSMAHSLEVRVPFLDHHLADNLSGSVGDEGGPEEKALLKHAVAELLPEIVLEREKSGFTFPFAEWLDGELSDVVETSLSRERLDRTPLDTRACRDVLSGYRSEDVHWSRVWALVVLSRWIESHHSDIGPTTSSKS